MEQIDLTTVETLPDNNYYRVNELHMYWIGKFIRIELRGENGETLEFSYDGDEARSLMLALNKANLSTKSLHKRIMEKLINDGLIDGTISGSSE